MSRSSVRLTVPAETGVSYVFSVRAENRFGPSEYSGDSESITIPEPTEGSSMLISINFMYSDSTVHVVLLKSLSLCLSIGEGTDELEMREVIGIAVGVGIVVLLLLFCCVLLVCALLTRGMYIHWTLSLHKHYHVPSLPMRRTNRISSTLHKTATLWYCIMTVLQNNLHVHCTMDLEALNLIKLSMCIS